MGFAQNDSVLDALVVGGGPAGMAAGYALGKAGLRYRILERGDRVAGSWHGYWDSLRLNSPRFFSSLPGTRIERAAGRWPSRTDMIAYFERYAAKNALPIEFGQQVERLDRADGLWRVETADGPRLARAVVVATGLNAKPYMPPWPGSDEFTGTLLHAMDFKNPRSFAGKRVLVVGAGMTGYDIAVDLVSARAAKVWLSIRTPPLMFPPSVMGVPVSLVAQIAKRIPRWTHPVLDAWTLMMNRFSEGNLTRYGIGKPTEGLMKSMKTRGHGATIERGFVPAVKAGQIEIVPSVEGFSGSDVLLSDGARLTADVVIAATGQRPSLDQIVGHLDVLGADGRPRAHGADCAPNAPNLHFIGYRIPPGQLPDMGLDSRAAARRIKKALGTERSRGGAGPAPSGDGNAAAPREKSASAAT